MQRHRGTALALALLAAACGPAAQPGPTPTPAPIPANVPPLRSVPPEEVEALRSGDGMGQARAAELNGYPGPKHVLEMADSLGLTADQRSRVQAIRDRMLQQARALGAEILAGEAGLEAAFREGGMDAEQLGRRVRALGDQRARLRLVHLEAHLETTAVLTAEQRQRYQHLRGHHQAH